VLADSGFKIAHPLLPDESSPIDDLCHIPTKIFMRHLRLSEHLDDRVERSAHVVGLKAHERNCDHAANDDHQTLKAEKGQKTMRTQNDGEQNKQKTASRPNDRDTGIRLNARTGEFLHVEIVSHTTNTTIEAEVATT
jgi:hypothetical protein